MHTWFAFYHGNSLSSFQHSRHLLAVVQSIYLSCVLTYVASAIHVFLNPNYGTSLRRHPCVERRGKSSKTRKNFGPVMGAVAPVGLEGNNQELSAVGGVESWLERELLGVEVGQMFRSGDRAYLIEACLQMFSGQKWKRSSVLINLVLDVILLKLLVHHSRHEFPLRESAGFPPTKAPVLGQNTLVLDLNIFRIDNKMKTHGFTIAFTEPRLICAQNASSSG